MTKRYIDVSSMVFAHPVQIVRALTQEQLDAQAAALPDKIKKARAFAQDETIFDDAENAPYFWAAIASNNRLDAYSTRMHETSLTNYLRAINEGVSFQNSHRRNELPLGRSLGGELKTTPNGLYTETNRLHEPENLIELIGDFYTLRDMKLTDLNTNDFIRGVRSGIVKDVSIGFHGGFYRCSIDGLDLWDWDCPHIPGLYYNIMTADGQPSGEQVLCFAWVENANLSEVSAVFDGATEGAAIIKANAEAEAGRVTPEQTRIIEARFKLHLPTKRAAVNVPEKPEKDGERNMAKETEEKPKVTDGAPELSETERAALAMGNQFSIFLRDAETGQPVLLKGFREMNNLEGMKRIIALAADGRRFRNSAIEEAKKQGARAMGTDWKEEDYNAILDNPDTPIATIERFAADWQRTADSLLKGGRKTGDDNPDDNSDDGKTEGRRGNAPLAAYRS